MTISLNGGANPRAVYYNGAEVEEVYYSCPSMGVYDQLVWNKTDALQATWRGNYGSTAEDMPTIEGQNYANAPVGSESEDGTYRVFLPASLQFTDGYWVAIQPVGSSPLWSSPGSYTKRLATVNVRYGDGSTGTQDLAFRLEDGVLHVGLGLVPYGKSFPVTTLSFVDSTVDWHLYTED